MVNFYKSDQAAEYDGWHYIGIEGKEILALTNNEMRGIIIRYASTADNWEFCADLSGIEELGKNNATYFTVFGDDYLDLYKRFEYQNSKERIGKIAWKNTKKRQFYETSSPKKLTPRNIITALIKKLYKEKMGERL